MLITERGKESRMKKFIKNHWDTIMNWSIGAGGIIATIVAANKTEGNGFGYLYVSLLVMQTVLLCFGLYTVKIKNSYAAEYEKLNMELTQHKKINQEQTEERVLVVQSGKKNVATIISNLKNMSKLNNDLCNRIPAISSQSYHVLETLKESGVQDANLLRKEIIESYKDFSNGLFDLFKRYSSHLLTNTVKMVEAYLRLQGYNHKVSATIKLFDDCYYENSGRREDVVVYTAFRDKETYDGKKEREIGQIPYTIDGNVDFTMCLTKDHYVINNAKKDSESYFNEHLDFDAYYNCAVVVAIRVKLVDNTYKYMGYLCCDCLNKENSEDIFDSGVAQLLYSMAQYYATFLETLDSNWKDRAGNANAFPRSFINVIYDKTYKGTRH